MPRYLIELTHADEFEGCVQALHAIEQYGAHLLTSADWGCYDGVHCAWMVVDVDSREEAVRVVPPQFRPEARVVALNKFTREEIASMVAGLKG